MPRTWCASPGRSSAEAIMAECGLRDITRYNAAFDRSELANDPAAGEVRPATSRSRSAGSPRWPSPSASTSPSPRRAPRSTSSSPTPPARWASRFEPRRQPSDSRPASRPAPPRPARSPATQVQGSYDGPASSAMGGRGASRDDDDDPARLGPRAGGALKARVHLDAAAQAAGRRRPRRRDHGPARATRRGRPVRGLEAGAVLMTLDALDDGGAARTTTTKRSTAPADGREAPATSGSANCATSTAAAG